MAASVFGDAAIPEAERLATTLARHIVKEKVSVVNTRKIRQDARLPGLRKTDNIQEAIDVLIEADWLLPTLTTIKVGRPKKDYVVNSKLWDALNDKMA